VRKNLYLLVIAILNQLNVLKKKNYKTKFLISSILKKSTSIILKNKKIKKKNYVGKHRNNP
jgi:hypothetical protein